MKDTGLKRTSAIVVVTFITIALVTYYIYRNPLSMVELNVLDTIPDMVVTACIVSSLLYVGAVLSLKLKWRILLIGVGITTSVTLAGLLIVTLLPGVSFLSIYQHRGPAFSQPLTIQQGDVPASVLEAIRNQIPYYCSVYMADATDAKNGRYWFILEDSTEREKQRSYAIGFLDQQSMRVSRSFSPDQLWSEIQQQQGLPTASRFSQFDGIPTRENDNSKDEQNHFSQNRTIYFRTENGKVYIAKLIPQGTELQVWTSKQ